MSVFSAQVTVGTVATLLNATADKDAVYGKHITVCNRGAADIFIGPATVTTGTGFKLAANDMRDFQLGDAEDLYGIVAAATQPAHVLLTSV